MLLVCSSVELISQHEIGGQDGGVNIPRQNAEQNNSQWTALCNPNLAVYILDIESV